MTRTSTFRQRLFPFPRLLLLAGALLALAVFLVADGVPPALASHKLDAPTGLTATAGDGQVSLTWNAVTGADRYSVQQAEFPGGTASARTFEATSRTVTGLTNGTTYRFRVYAFDFIGSTNHTQSDYTDWVYATPLAEDDTLLVTNLQQTPDAGGAILYLRAAGNDIHSTRAQAFTTGAQTGGYTLGSVGAYFNGAANATQAATLRAEIWSADSGGPNEMLHNLTVPTTITARTTVDFAAPANTTLDAGTTYYLVIYSVGSFTPDGGLGVTASDGEDSGSASGWSIGDSYHGVAADEPTSTSTWTPVAQGQSLRIRVNLGTGPTDLSALVVEGSTDGTNFSALAGGAALTPDFAFLTTSYRAVVGSDVTHVRITPTAADSDSTVGVRKGSTGDFTAVTSGSASSAIALDVGNNEITVRVTAADSSTRDYTLTVRRGSAPGLLDLAFDTDGVVTTAIGARTDRARAVAIQSDGKIVTAGQSDSATSGAASNDFAVARYTAAGALDTTFSSDGKVTTDIGSSTEDRAYAVAIQSDGKIVVAGNSGNDFAVARYTAAGVLDTTFSSDGKVTTDIGSSTVDIAHAVAIQSDGKIVVAGYSNTSGNRDFAVVRYTTAGALDTSFSSDGKVTTAVGSGHDRAYAVAIDADGKIVAAGSSNNGDDNDFAVVRYTTAGALDTDFSSDGKVTTEITASINDEARAVAIQADGRIVAAGYVGSLAAGGDFALVRYTDAGVLDTTFSADGKVTTSFTTHLDVAQAMAVRSDGKIVAAGYSNSSGNNYSDFAVAVYRADGNLDTGFDADGKATTTISAKDDAIHGVDIDSDGNIVGAGESDDDFALARYLGTLSGNANLSGLTMRGSADGTSLSFTALSGAAAVLPAFDAYTTSYRATVGNDIAYVDLVPTLADTDAELEFGKAGTTLSLGLSGIDTTRIPLDVGDNEIIVRVTAPDGSTRDYTVTVRRVPSDTAWHATLEVRDAVAAGTGCENTATQDSDKCSSATTLTDDDFTVGDEDYEITLINSWPGLETLTFIVTGDVDSDYQALNFCVGGDAFALSGVATSGTNKGRGQWTVAITWAAGDLVSLSIGASCGTPPALSALTVGGANVGGSTFSYLSGPNALLPAFDADTTAYRATVSGVARVWLTPTVVDSNSTVGIRKGPTGDFTAVTSGTASSNIPLDLGDNVITVRVTASGGTRDYTVTVRRVPPRTTWFATLEVQDLLVAGAVDIGDGCDSGTSGESFLCSFTSILTDDDFRVGTQSYDVSSIFIDPSGDLDFRVTTGTVDSAYRALNFCVGSEAFALTDVPISGTNAGRGSWSSHGLTWAVGDLVSVSIGDSCTNPLDLSGLTVAGSTDGSTFTALSGAAAVLPAFDVDTASYRATVGNDVTHVQLTATWVSSFATVGVRKGSGSFASLTRGSAGGAIALDVGDNEIIVRITAFGGSTRDYTVIVRRVTSGTAWHATLQAQHLVISGVDIGDGCENTVSSAECSSTSVLTDDDFTVGSQSYDVETVLLTGNAIELHVAGTVGSAYQALNFCVGADEFALSGVPASGASVGVGSWTTSLTWAAGDLVSVSVGSSCAAMLPDPPTSLEAASAMGGLWVTWTAPTGTFQSYDVQFKLTTAADQAATTPNNPSTGWVDAGHTGTDAFLGIPYLAQGTAHHVRVRAVNVIGGGDWAQAQGTPGGAAVVGFQQAAYEATVSSGNHDRVTFTVTIAPVLLEASSATVVALTGDPEHTAGTPQNSFNYSFPHTLSTIAVALPAGASTATFQVEALDRPAAQKDVKLVLGLQSVGGAPYTVGAGRTVLTISNTNVVTIAFSSSETINNMPVFRAAEGGTAALTVVTDRMANFPFAVDLTTGADNDATNPDATATTDYVLDVTKTTFARMTTSSPSPAVSVRTITDGVSDDGERLLVHLSVSGLAADERVQVSPDSALVIIGAATTSTPTAPTSLSAAPDHQRLTLTWVGPPETVTGYDVQYKLTADQTWTDAGEAGPEPTFTVLGLTNHEDYDVRVRAKNTAATTAAGSWGTSIQATPYRTSIPAVRLVAGDCQGPECHVIEGQNLSVRAVLTGTWHRSLSFPLTVRWGKEWVEETTDEGGNTVPAHLVDYCWIDDPNDPNDHNDPWEQDGFTGHPPRCAESSDLGWHGRASKTYGQGKTYYLYSRPSSVSVYSYRIDGYQRMETKQDGDSDDDSFTVAFDTTHPQWPEGVEVEGASSLLITIIDDDRAGPPAEPRHLQVTAGDGSLDLAWDAPLLGDPTGYDVQYTRVYPGHITDQTPGSDPDDGWVQVERSGAGTSQAITEKLKDGIMHWVRVRATNTYPQNGALVPGESAWVSGMGRPVVKEPKPEEDPTRATLSSVVVHYDGDPAVEDFRRWQPARRASYGYGVIIPEEFISIGPDRSTVLVTHAKVKVGATHADSTIRVGKVTYPNGVRTVASWQSLASGALSDAIELNAHSPNTGVDIEVTDGSVVKTFFLNIDPPPRTYSLSPGAAAVEGHDAPLTLTLSREAPEGGLAFTVTATYGSAGSGDVGTITSPVTVPGGATSLDIAVPLVDDALAEDDETFTVTVAPVGSGWAVTPDATATATVTIIDNDDAGVTVNAAGTLSVAEGGSATYTVVLDSRPTSAVAVIAISGDAGAASMSPASHTIAPSAWNAPVTFTVSGVTDDDSNNETVTITHRVSSQDTGYRNIPVSTVQVEVSDTTGAQQQGAETPNNAPTVSAAIGDATIVNKAGTHQVSLSGVFDDADADDLTVTAVSSNNAVATVSVSADYSTLTVNAQARGTATITVTADDGNGGTVADSFAVRVKAAPLLTGARTADVTRLAPGTTQEFSLSGVFTDPDGDTLTISAASSNSAIAAVSVAADQSKLTMEGVSEGTATVTVTARDSDGNTVSDAFPVTVGAPPNNPPTVASAIGDATIVNETGTRQVSLSSVFDDADDDSLTVTAVSSNNAMATASVSADYSTLTVTASSRGTATVTVTANDGNGGSVSDTFTVRVKAAPQVASAIGDVSGLTAGSSQDVFLSGVFTDADGDTLTISAASSNNATATVSVAAGGSSLTVAGAAEGTATITVTARDSDGNRVSESFRVEVVRPPEPEEEEAPGGPPIVVSPLPDITFEGRGHREISLAGVFQDPDGQELTFSIDSSDYGVVRAWKSGDSHLALLALGNGTVTVTVTARDPDGNEVSDSFQVTVTPAG